MKWWKSWATWIKNVSRQTSFTSINIDNYIDLFLFYLLEMRLINPAKLVMWYFLLSTYSSQAVALIFSFHFLSTFFFFKQFPKSGVVSWCHQAWLAGLWLVANIFPLPTLPRMLCSSQFSEIIHILLDVFFTDIDHVYRDISIIRFNHPALATTTETKVQFL